MKPLEFYQEVEHFLRQKLKGDLASFKTKYQFGLLKIYYWDLQIHFEVWIQNKLSQIELGLHFEGDRQTNLTWLVKLSKNSFALRAELGAIEFEHWTKNWTRIHKIVQLKPLNIDFVKEVGELLGKFISVLQPMLAEKREEVI